MAISETKSTEGSNGPKDQASIAPGPPHRVNNTTYKTKNKIHTYTK